MKIAVCISNVPDTTTRIRFDASKTNIDYTGVQWIINPWDELALTRALELKEQAGSGITEVTAVTVGKAETEPTIRKALAIGADNAVRIDADPKDALFTAKQLAGFFSTEPYDIIVTGIESSDYNGGAVGGMLAALMGIHAISGVSGLSIENGSVLVNRETDGAQQTLKTRTPVALVVQKGIAIVARIPSMRGIMGARTKSLKVIPAVEAMSMTSVAAFDTPPQRGSCKMIDADNAGQLISLLHHEAKVI